MLLNKPELAVFDPSNKEHRAAARAFLKRKAWVDSPIRFAHDPDYGSVAEQVQAKLLQWYVDKEEARLEKAKPKPITPSKKLAFELMGIASEYRA